VEGRTNESRMEAAESRFTDQLSILGHLTVSRCLVQIHLKEEDEEVQLTKVVAKIEPAAEQELALPRRRGR
jgi:hypothetical protein